LEGCVALAEAGEGARFEDEWAGLDELLCLMLAGGHDERWGWGGDVPSFTGIVAVGIVRWWFCEGVVGREEWSVVLEECST